MFEVTVVFFEWCPKSENRMFLTHIINKELIS